ncbi:enoyl-CoA hydratase/isomerase family protein [Aquipuribacter sp. MA13-6]|uniref:enoyl-CoA hydratase/isomerase family protein n=1 Tax=unclassified Aquipuribacter TaxID=2635084 RepID=UPI003EED5D4D
MSEQDSTSQDAPVRVETTGAVATVVLDRPAAMNSMTTPVKVALLAALEQVAADDAVRCVVLTGTGRAFSVGQDLREHAEVLDSGDLTSLWSTVPTHYNPISTLLASMPKPVVAAVNGVAAGAGASFAMAADLRLVGSSAGFNLAFTGIGLSADSGSTWYLPRLVGSGRAMDLLLRPRTVRAEEALAIGLASEVVPDADLPARTAEVAATLAAGPTLAYAAVRQAVAFSASHDLAASLANESDRMTATGSTQDHADAVRSFLAKERPTFHAR